MTQDNQLNALEQKIAAVRDLQNQKRTESHKGSSTEAESMNVGLRAGGELVAGFVAGGLMGYGLDHWLGTSPLFMILLMILGICSGFLNIYRLTKGLDSAVGFAQLHQGEKKGKEAQLLTPKEEDSDRGEPPAPV
jgi:ATP synthase protein I